MLMPQRVFPSKRRAASVLLPLLLACAATPCVAAPYAITYTGQTFNSSLPGVADGEAYTLTLIVDNGGTSAASQTWGAVECAIWRMSGGARVFTQPRSDSGNTASAGSAVTGADGALTQMFTSADGVATLDYTATGFSPALTPPVWWVANGSTPVFYDGNSLGFGDANVGISMAPADWSAPRRVAGACDDADYTPPTPTHTTAVPALGPAALALLAGLLGAVGWRRKTLS